jgi:hypothetical protein
MYGGMSVYESVDIMYGGKSVQVNVGYNTKNRKGTESFIETGRTMKRACL